MFTFDRSIHRTSSTAIRVALLSSLALGASACLESEVESESSDPEFLPEAGALFRMALAEGTDVEAYDLVVTQVACEGEAPPAGGYAETFLVPVAGVSPDGGFVIDDPFSAATLHSFGQWSVPLEPGCYEASASPLDGNGDPSMDCLPTNAVAFTVDADLTQEVTMISNCPEGGVGIGDLGVLENLPPTGAIVPGTTTVHQCSGLTVCFEAHDANDDPLEFVWIAEPTVDVDTSLPPSIDEYGNWLSCAVLTPSQPGQAEISWSVYDLLADGSRVEDHASVQGNSHATVTFPIHTIPGVGDCQSFGFTYLGEGECRQADGQYPLNFSISYPDLDPHTAADNASIAASRCESKCLEHSDWCLAVEVVTRDIWSTPHCRLVTDRATFEGTGNTLQNDTWGGQQIIDGESYQTYCGGNGDCTQTNWGGGSLNPRAGYHCSHLVGH